MTILASITVLAPLTNDRFGHKVTVMTNIHPIISILSRWPSRRAVYEDALTADPDLDMVAVHRWFQRGSVPSKYDVALLQGADRRGIGLHFLEIANARSGHTKPSGAVNHSAQDRRQKPAKTDSCAEGRA